jgi:hypothetical protein
MMAGKARMHLNSCCLTPSWFGSFIKFSEEEEIQPHCNPKGDSTLKKKVNVGLVRNAIMMQLFYEEAIAF